MEGDYNFEQFPIFLKSLIIIGFISTIIFIILLITVISLFFESKTIKPVNLDEYKGFLDDFTNEIPSTICEEKYPSLHKIKDLQGNILKDLLEIEII